MVSSWSANCRICTWNNGLELSVIVKFLTWFCHIWITNYGDHFSLRWSHCSHWQLNVSSCGQFRPVASSNELCKVITCTVAMVVKFFSLSLISSQNCNLYHPIFIIGNNFLLQATEWLTTELWQNFHVEPYMWVCWPALFLWKLDISFEKWGLVI